MKNISIIFVMLTLSTLLTSCFKERIDLDLNNDQNKRVVVTAWLTDSDEQQSVLINYTSDYLDGSNIEYINNAEVELSYDTDNILLNHSENGIYELPLEWRAEVGKTYTLTITHETQSYEATSLMRPMPEVENTYSGFAEIDDEFGEEEPEKLHGIYFSFQELEGEGDGYFGIDYLKGTNGGDTLVNGSFIDDEFIDGEYFDDVYLSYRGYMDADTAILKTYNIGREASRFLQDIIDETFRNGLFDAPPVNVRSNFSNGALGYFITSGSIETEVIVKY